MAPQQKRRDCSEGGEVHDAEHAEMLKQWTKGELRWREVGWGCRRGTIAVVSEDNARPSVLLMYPSTSDESLSFRVDSPWA